MRVIGLLVRPSLRFNNNFSRHEGRNRVHMEQSVSQCPELRMNLLMAFAGP